MKDNTQSKQPSKKEGGSKFPVVWALASKYQAQDGIVISSLFPKKKDVISSARLKQKEWWSEHFIARIELQPISPTIK